MVVASYEFGDEFQRHALAVLARIPGAIVRYRSALDYTYFGSKALRQVAEVLFEHVDAHMRLPSKATLVEDIAEKTGDDDHVRLRRIVESMYKEDVSDAKAVLNRVIEFGQQQAFVNATTQAAEMIDRGDRNVRPLFDSAAAVGEDILDLGLDYGGSVADRVRYYKNPERYDDRIRTGIPHLDAMLGGGLGRGELGVILAPPKRGKTTCLINVGFGALVSVHPYNVAHYSLEMDDKKVSRRYDDRLMGARKRFRDTDPDRYGAMLEERVKQLVRGRLFVKSYPTRTASVSKIRSHLSMLATRNFHPDVLIVDYADIMRPERRTGEVRHEQAGIYEDLRQLAGEFSCAVWTGSQARRGALEKDTVTIDDFAESFEKAAIVDVALGFCQSQDERIESKMRLFGAALRNQEDGRTIECSIERGQARIRSLALFDVAGSRILLDGEQHDHAAETTSTVRKAQRQDVVESAKRAGGVKRTKRARSATKKSATKKTGTGKKTASSRGRRSDRPSKQVA